MWPWTIKLSLSLAGTIHPQVEIPSFVLTPTLVTSILLFIYVSAYCRCCRLSFSCGALIRTEGIWKVPSEVETSTQCHSIGDGASWFAVRGNRGPSEAGWPKVPQKTCSSGVCPEVCRSGARVAGSKRGPWKACLDSISREPCLKTQLFTEPSHRKGQPGRAADFAGCLGTYLGTDNFLRVWKSAFPCTWHLESAACSVLTPKKWGWQEQPPPRYRWAKEKGNTHNA